MSDQPIKYLEYIERLYHFLKQYFPKVPRTTIKVIPISEECYWNIGSVSGEPSMQISGKCYVTNITEQEIYLLSTHIIKPRVEGMVLTKHPENNIFGEYPVLGRNTTQVITDFWITPPIINEGEDLKASISIYDQFGNEHKVKNISFKGLVRKPQQEQSDREELIVESTHSISDPIEKNIASVLKDEINRYKNCGIREGGLGSIQTTINGKSYNGLGTDWQRVGDTRNQLLIYRAYDHSYLDNYIYSENEMALRNLYDKINSAEEREKFFESLINRIDKHTEYASIGYFILYIVFCLDSNRLPSVLSKAINDLQGDKIGGFTNTIKMLDGLLRIDHPKFSLELLDYLEKAIEELEENRFKVIERISAIRAYRLSNEDWT